MVLLVGLLMTCRLMKFSRQLFAGALTKCLFNELTSLATFTACKTLGLDLRLSRRRDDDFDGLAHAAPPTETVNLIEPSASDCSVTVCPFLRASSFVFSTA